MLRIWTWSSPIGEGGGKSLKLFSTELTTQRETFIVNLGSVEEATGISSGIRDEAIETNPGNTTYQNRTILVQVLRSVFQEFGQTDGQQRLSYAVFLRDTLFQSSDENRSNLTVAVTVNGTSIWVEIC